MKEKIKISILVSFIVVLIIFIIFVTMLFITKNKDNNNNNNNNSNNNSDNVLYNTWNAYKTEVIRDNEPIHTIELFNMYLNINDNNFINICYQKDGEKVCNATNYVYDNNILIISNSDLYLKGSYKVTFQDDIMILENTQSNDMAILRHYYRKSEG